MLTLHGPAGTATTHCGYRIRFGAWMIRLAEDGSLDDWHGLFVSRNPLLQDQLCDLAFQQESQGGAVLTGQAFVWREHPRSDRNRMEATDRLMIHADRIRDPADDEWRNGLPEEMRFEENGIVLRLLFPDPANPLQVRWDLSGEADDQT